MLVLKLRLRPRKLEHGKEFNVFDRDEMKDIIHRLGNILVDKIKSSVEKNLTTLEKYGRPRTHKLENAFFVRLVRGGAKKATLAIGMSPKVPYVAIHEFGGYVAPEGDRPMPIPVYTTMQKFGWESIRDYVAKFRHFIRNDVLFIITKYGKGRKGKEIYPAFRFKWIAFIPPRSYLTLAIEDFMSDTEVKDLLDKLNARIIGFISDKMFDIEKLFAEYK